MGRRSQVPAPAIRAAQEAGISGRRIWVPRIRREEPPPEPDPTLEDDGIIPTLGPLADILAYVACTRCLRGAEVMKLVAARSTRVGITPDEIGEMVAVVERSFRMVRRAVIRERMEREEIEPPMMAAGAGAGASGRSFPR